MKEPGATLTFVHFFLGLSIIIFCHFEVLHNVSCFVLCVAKASNSKVSIELYSKLSNYEVRTSWTSEHATEQHSSGSGGRPGIFVFVSLS